MSTRELLSCDACNKEIDQQDCAGWMHLFRCASENEMALQFDFCSDSCLMSFATEAILADEIKLFGDG
jgi:hypothetical protein